jgi:hypothetical protein
MTASWLAVSGHNGGAVVAVQSVAGAEVGTD